MKFKSINQFLCESLTNLSTKQMNLGIFNMKDYTKIMDAEQRKHILSMKMIFRWRQRVQSRINITMLEKQDSIASQIESHCPSQFEKQFQGELRNRFRRHNPVMTKRQKNKHLLQTIK